MEITFLGIGAQKAGTSSLHDILKQHSQIYLPKKKEAHFFNFSDRYNKGFRWFMNTFFPDNYPGKILGEFTPEYLYVKEVPARIDETLGRGLKFIVVLRHPVDRAVSHYNMMFRKGIETLDFHDAIEREPQRIMISEQSDQDYSYTSKGLYTEQIKRYFEIFPRENFLLLIFEKDIVKNIEKTIDKIQLFLGLDYEKLDCSLKSNEAFTPYSIKLNRLIRNNKILKKIGRSLFPFPIRVKIRTAIFKLNKKSYSKALFSLSKSEREKIFHTYFYKDVKLLEDLIKISFNNIWYTDVN